MKGLETGKNKIQKICDVLRKETLEPAKQEAAEIVENAHIAASQILEDAQKKGQELLSLAEKEIAEKKKVFESSLQMACRQGIEQLKQKIESHLFNQELSSLVLKEMGNEKVIASILNSFLKTMEEKGIEDEFTALIPKTISPRSINALIASQFLNRLEKHSVEIGDFAGGAKIQLKEKQITIDITENVVKELIALYIRRDFRDLIFQT